MFGDTFDDLLRGFILDEMEASGGVTNVHITWSLKNIDNSTRIMQYIGIQESRTMCGQKEA